MTQSELTEHRLKMLEDVATEVRQTVRDVDLMKASQARTESMLVEVRTEAHSRAEQLHASLSRLHTRFDELSQTEYVEQGAKTERQRLRTVLVVAVTCGTALGGVLVGVAALFIP